MTWGLVLQLKKLAETYLAEQLQQHFRQSFAKGTCSLNIRLALPYRIIRSILFPAESTNWEEWLSTVTSCTKAEAYAASFQSNAIQPKHLLTLSSAQFGRMGVSVGDELSIREAIWAILLNTTD